MDDLNYVGPWKEVINAYDELIKTTYNMGMDLQPKKCKLLWPGKEPPLELTKELDARGISLAMEFSETLGAVIGINHKLMSDWAHNHVIETHGPLFTTLQNDAMSVQVAMIILRLCGVPRLNYLTRVMAPGTIRRAAREFDNMVLDAATRKLRLPKTLKTGAKLSLTLPCREGGFGLRSLARVSPAAYWSSNCQMAPLLAEIPRVKNFDTSVPFMASLRDAHKSLYVAGACKNKDVLLSNPLNYGVRIGMV